MSPANLFQKQMEQVDTAEMREATGIELYADFLRAICHTQKAYIMDGIRANYDRVLKGRRYAIILDRFDYITQDLS